MNISEYRTGIRQLPKKQRGHTTPKPPLVSLDESGFLRVCHCLWLLGLSHSAFYDGIKSGRIPAHDAKIGRVPLWRTSTIRALVTGAVEGRGPSSD
jgi:predicted DNA-binding transcriptional regulator AlpA